MIGAQFARGVHLEIEVTSFHAAGGNFITRRCGPCPPYCGYYADDRQESNCTHRPHRCSPDFHLSSLLLGRRIPESYSLPGLQTSGDQHPITTPSSDLDHAWLKLRTLPDVGRVLARF